MDRDRFKLGYFAVTRIGGDLRCASLLVSLWSIEIELGLSLAKISV